MKSLKPSMREKKRYVLFDMPNVDSKDEAIKIIKKSIRDFLGELGYSKAAFVFVEFNPKTHCGIFAINRQEVEKVRASFVTSKTQIIIKRVSGILARCRSRKA